MVKNYRFEFMVSQMQLEKIRHQTHESGYIKMATYVRDIVLNRSQFLEEKILDTHRKMEEIHALLTNKPKSKHGRR